MFMTYLKKNIEILSSCMFEHLHSSRSKMKKWDLKISDLQNNFNLSHLLMSNVSIERMCKFLKLTGFNVLLQHLITLY